MGHHRRRTVKPAGGEAMPIAKVIRWNLALIVVVGLYGLITDEPYWRSVGHGPVWVEWAIWACCRLPFVVRRKHGGGEVRYSIGVVVCVALAAMEALPPARAVVSGRQLKADYALQLSHPHCRGRRRRCVSGMVVGASPERVLHRQIFLVRASSGRWLLRACASFRISRRASAARSQRVRA
jgi:hypothetical protein